MSSVADKVQWGATVVCALVAVSALMLAKYYKTEAENLTALRVSEAAKYEQSYQTVFELLQKEKRAYMDHVAELNRANAALLAERSGLRRDLKRLQDDLTAATAEECCRRSKDFVGFSDRAYDIAARCTAELGRKQQALEACVRHYEGVKVVNDSIK